MARTKTKPENGNGSMLGFEAKLWLAADKLRNNLDAAGYKHVVLGLIFLKYASDAFEEQHAMEIRCRKSGVRKSGVSPSFLPEKMRKDEPTPDYAPISETVIRERR
jgi:type I restriction-modification system DNA methylase subunit